MTKFISNATDLVKNLIYLDELNKIHNILKKKHEEFICDKKNFEYLEFLVEKNNNIIDNFHTNMCIENGVEYNEFMAAQKKIYMLLNKNLEKKIDEIINSAISETVIIKINNNYNKLLDEVNAKIIINKKELNLIKFYIFLLLLTVFLFNIFFCIKN